MRVIILAAGRGSRMKDLTDERPKCLLEVRGKRLIDWQLTAFRAAGIERIGVVTGYRREMLAGFGDAEFHNARWAQTQMLSSLACAESWLADDDCIVSYSDIFYESAAIASLRDCAADIAITYDPHWLRLWERRFEDPLSDAETFRLNADGTLADIGDRPASLDEVEGQYMGLLRFTPAGWAEVTRIRCALPAVDADRLHMTGTLQKVIAAGRVSVMAVPYVGEWGEVDSQDDLAAYGTGR